MQIAALPFESRPRPTAANADLLAAHRIARLQVPVPPESPPRETVEIALSRILASPAFRLSRRHRDFLRYVVEAALDGRAHCLKEVVIGLEVFARRIDGYDPGRNSIVRVEARRLRKKLEAYYDREGRTDELEIGLPVGGYAPAFRMRSLAQRLERAKPVFLVLPFVATCVDEGQAGFGAGLTDQLVDRLGSDPGLKVVAPMLASTLRERVVDIGALRADHGVDYVIDGSLLGHGTRRRCVAHLSRTADRLRLWSRCFDFDLAVESDVFAIHDRIVAALFDAAVAARAGD